MNPNGIPALLRIRSLTLWFGSSSRSKSSASHALGSAERVASLERSSRSPRHVNPTRVFSIAPLCFIARSVANSRSPASRSCDGSRSGEALFFFLRGRRRPFFLSSSSRSSSDEASGDPPAAASSSSPSTGAARLSAPTSSDTSFIVNQHAVTTVCALGASELDAPPNAVAEEEAASSSSGTAGLRAFSSVFFGDGAPAALAASRAAAPCPDPDPRASGWSSSAPVPINAPSGAEMDARATPVTR